MRALVVTNMWPSPSDPALGSFVRDQVEALRRDRGRLEVEVFAFAPGRLPRARRASCAGRYRGERFDVVHAHFGLTAWPALALRGAPHVVTLHGTDLAPPALAADHARRAAARSTSSATVSARRWRAELPAPACRERVAVLPCGVDSTASARCRAREARARLGLDPDGRYLLFPADPGAPGQAPRPRRELVAGDRRRAADARRRPARRGAALGQRRQRRRSSPPSARASASPCSRRSPATCRCWRRPTGIHAEALGGSTGTLCAPSTSTPGARRWRPHLDQPDPRVAGRARAERSRAERMAARVVDGLARAVVGRRSLGGAPPTRRRWL